jgi:hypothetical protein
MTLLPMLLACASAPAGDTAPVEWLDPYACGWERSDPGTLTATGAAIGDVIADFAAPDQCGEEYRLWDSYGGYTMLVSIPFW